MKEEARWRWAALGLITLLAGVFGFLNSGEAVAIHFGLFVLYQVSLVVLVFVAFLLGMTTMFLLGLRHDLKVRRILRERRLDRAPLIPNRVDHPPDPDT